MNFSSGRPRVGTCLFCDQLFKLAGTLANHIEREHHELKYHLSKRKPSNTNERRSTSEMQETDLGRPPHSQDFEIELGRLFSKFLDFSPENEALERIDYVDIIYDIVIDNEGAEALPSGTNESIEGLTTFPAGHKAGKATSVSPFIQQRQPSYNFFSPFQNILDFKLARFFYTAQVPKTQINKFFMAGFVEQGTDVGGGPRFSFHYSYGLYKKLDAMIIDPVWKNGFVDFRLAKKTEFWYRDILEVLKYLLRLKFFALHMFWAPVRHFDTQKERVYTEMNTGS